MAGCASGLVRLPLRGQLRLGPSPGVTRLPASRLTRPSMTGSQSTNNPDATAGPRRADLQRRSGPDSICVSGPATYNGHYP